MKNQKALTHFARLPAAYCNPTMRRAASIAVFGVPGHSPESGKHYAWKSEYIGCCHPGHSNGPPWPPKNCLSAEEHMQRSTSKPVADIRLHWRGLAGGVLVWQQIEEFFSRLHHQSCRHSPPLESSHAL